MDEIQTKKKTNNKKTLPVILLILGIILFLLGSYQNDVYENGSLQVQATVTDIRTTDETDDGPVSYKHVYYGEYTANGKTYTDKKLHTAYTGSSKPKYSRGDTIEITVNPENPGKKVAEGGIFLIVGFILILWNAVCLFKNRKEHKEATP